MNLSSLKRISMINICLWVLWPASLLGLLVFLFFTCGHQGLSSKEAKNAPEQNTSVATVSPVDSIPQGRRGQQDIKTLRTFPMTDIPSVLTSHEDRAAYLAEHYWDRFDFSDTTLLRLPEITEQGFADYLSVLPHTAEETAVTSIKNMLAASLEQDRTGKMYAYFLSNYKSYLHDPNSPFANEEYYIPVTQYIIADRVSDEATKSRARFDLKLMGKNRKGTPATDFSYLTIDHKKGTLYKLKKDYTLLYFNNPDCQACRETTAYLDQSPLIRHLLKKGMLDILALYPDEDTALWQARRDEIPLLWINARDGGQRIKDKLIYDLKAIPCLYLLDRDKKVLLKDAAPGAVEQFFNTDTNRKG